ncbi:Glucan endo-1,3-beta-glucosidase [Dendrobium catenatum]|uniref:glucan endo-1,3-beta-D-glucosidase n=1 Tax=Dendrobium catenatum TaxID=906689 RepID=A0A2I0X8R2_9ASPA|nr:Glucan endo-1,3-beta-glucosidase [Dendrobium catenatum]
MAKNLCNSPTPLFALILPMLLLNYPLSSNAFSIGVNYGALADNLPPPAQVAAFLKDRTFIDRVKLFDSNPDMIRAFAGTGIALIITAANSDIPSLSRLPGATSWVANNISPFYPATNISLIAVGNEILATADRNLIAHLVPALRSLSAALSAAGFHQIRVSTPHSLGILSASEPPSSGRFRRGYDRVIFAPMLDFHRKSKTPFVVNPYPYFGYSSRTLNYALFKPNPGFFDPVTRINYTNMFDAQMDAVFSAMSRLGYGDVQIAVGESGWPSAGDPGQVGINVEDAASYNGQLIQHVTSGKGTPLMPNRTFETYVFSLFNEDLKPGPTAERNFGLFRPDFSPVYDVGVLRGGSQFWSLYAALKNGNVNGMTNDKRCQGGGPTPAPTAASKWCVAAGGATEAALQANIDYACSTAGVDCRPIQAGGPCFDPNTAQAHANYAMNAYYQFAGRHVFNCDFGRTGVIVTKNPSEYFRAF